MSSVKKYGLLWGMIVLAGVLLLPTPAALPTAGHRMLGILIFSVVIWMTEAVSCPVSGAIIMTLMAFLLGTAPDMANPAKLLGTGAALKLALDVQAHRATLLGEALATFGPARVGLVLGTSTAGIGEAELAVAAARRGEAVPLVFDYRQQELGSPSEFLARHLGLEGPAYTLSTACSSSARAFISGQRMLAAGLVDAVLVGGADSLCGLTLNGFDSLESLSCARCQPFDEARQGINIGEGAALFLLSRQPAPIALLGAGESSDAWHISAPHPDGVGAEAAMGMALAQAGLTPEQVGYINLHGTATRLNDAMESQAVYRLFGDRVPCSSTKPLTGHVLGAAGAIEAALACLLLEAFLCLPRHTAKRPSPTIRP